MKNIYLASPYSHRDTMVMENRFTTICIVAGKLMAKGYNVFSPIAHSHPISQHLSNQIDHEFCLGQDLSFLNSWADELLVCMMDGWETSKGIKIEVEVATRLHLPIRYVRVEDLDNDIL